MTAKVVVLLARAVAASGVFTVRLGQRSLGEHLASFLRRWQDTWLVKRLCAKIPLVPLYRLALHSYEPETTGLFKRLLKPGMTVVDVGAQIGQYTVIAAMEIGRKGHVYAFEPDPHSLPILRQNVQLSEYEDCITIVPAAVADKCGKAEFFLGENGTSSIFPVTYEERESVTVETVSLDWYFGDLGWPNVDLMKMDIEGGRE